MSTPSTGGSPPDTIILVAYYAPPALGIAANRVAAAARSLRKKGWRVVVVAPRDVHHHTGATSALDEIEVLRTRNPEPSRLLGRLAGGRVTKAAEGGTGQAVSAAPSGGLRDIVRNAVRNWLYVPDAQLSWIPFAASAVRKAIDEAPGRALVYSTSVPYSAHFAALLGRRSTSARWIAEYRDPWSTGFVEDSISVGRRTVDARLDQWVAAEADHLVVTSETTRKLFLASYPSAPSKGVSVVRNGWQQPGTGSPPGPGEPLLLRFVGTLLDASWAEPFLRGVKMVVEDGIAVRVEVIGPAESWLVALDTLGWGRPDWLSLSGFVASAEVPDLVASASALVLLRPGARWRFIVSGKTYDYLGSGRPILGWTSSGTEMTELLNTFGDYRHVQKGTDEDFAGAIADLAADQLSGCLLDRSESEVGVLSQESQFQRLHEVCRGVLAGALTGDGG